MKELIVDSFAGGGGASTGIEMALGVSPDYAMNHDAVALGMHAVNHPETKHVLSNIWKIDPDAVAPGAPIGLLWASPDCVDHSKAKGGKPLRKHIRDLAWVVVLWAQRRRPRVIILENVEEFKDWSPLIDDGTGRMMRCPDRKGQTFERWVKALRREGYKVEWRELRACDYGAPTIRKRLFVIARCDGGPIVWPKATHAKGGAGGLLPWRTAAEIIDWSLPCHSIFLTREEAKAVGVKRPLADATMARIAKGVKRYVIDAAEPFIVNLTHHGEGQHQPAGEPLRTVTGAHRGEKALVTPFVAYGQQGGAERAIAEPLNTVTASRKDTNAIVTPFLTKFRKDSAGADIVDPMPTVTANSFQKRPGGAPPVGLVTPFLVPRYGEREGQEPRTRSVDIPAPVIVPTANGGSLVAPHLMTMRNAGKPHNEADAPTHTVTAHGAHLQLVSAFLAQHNTDMIGHDARKPVSTIIEKGSTQAVVSAGIVNMKGTGGDQLMPRPVDAPVATITSQGWHVAEVRAFLMKYYGTDQDPELRDPLHTATAKARFGLVTVHGEEFQIVDIGMRMLSPRELFRAQGFPDRYVIDRLFDGTPVTKTDQIRMCGNSVCPDLAAALVRANYSVRETAPIEPLPFTLEAAE